MQAIALNPQSQSHYLDHLAPLCGLMGAPLLVLEESEKQFAEHYYPGLEVRCLPATQFNREYLLTHFDLIFLSDLWDRKSFHAHYAELEQRYKKRLRHVHCPHGFSDKGFYLRKCADEDIVLVYGQNMIDLLKNEGVFEKLPYYILTGNYRYTYYKQQRAFLDALYQKEIGSRFAKAQRTLLYAPTWKDQEETTSFFDIASTLFDQLPDSWNLLVKVHPQLEIQETAHYYHIVTRYMGRPNLQFLKDFPLVFPLLAHVDAYIGDTSSVGYDFLAFNKPMFFLNPQRRDAKSDRLLYLFRCGTEIKPDAYPLLYALIEATLPKDAERFSKIRSETYNYTFGPERPFEQIKKEILATALMPYIQ